MRYTERPAYIYRLINGERFLEYVACNYASAYKYINEKCGTLLHHSSINTYVDSEIPIDNTYVVCSYHKWKSVQISNSNKMIESTNTPKHLIFTSFNFKFEDNE
jgi:hypothetical protein